MSRIGNKPILIPEGVQVTSKTGLVELKGPRGIFQQSVHPDITVDIKLAEHKIYVHRPNDLKPSRALHGLVRALVANAVLGVSQGFEKHLEIVGTGYSAKLKGRQIELAIGFCNPVLIAIPEGIQIELPIPTKMVIRGMNKQLVGQLAANIRAIKPPDPYKGKGIRYENETIRLKAGKTFGSE